MTSLIVHSYIIVPHSALFCRYYCNIQFAETHAVQSSCTFEIFKRPQLHIEIMLGRLVGLNARRCDYGTSMTQIGMGSIVVSAESQQSSNQ